MATLTSNTSARSILKGPGVQARPLLVRSQFGAPPAADAAGTAPARSAEVEAAEREAASLLKRAQAHADRLAAQAQVELGRARAEAEELRRQAQTQLEEAGETITSAAEARRLLEQARQQATALVAEAESQVEAIHTAAHEQGLAEGRATGREEGERAAREQLAHELEVAHTMAAELLESRHELIAGAEPQIVRLAMEVARIVVAREVEADPDILKGTLTRAMLKAAGDDRLRLRLHPDDVHRLGDYLDTLAARFSARGVEVVPDPTVGRAGVIVETRSGTVDARLETQLDTIERSLLSVAGEA